MTNEKLYEDEIEGITKKCKSLHPAVCNGKPVPCIGTSCVVCDFYKETIYDCNDAYEAWTKSEAEPSRKGEMVTNGEKYKDVIKRMTRRHPPLHPAVFNGKVVPCTGLNCADCDLRTPPYYGGCSDNYEKWLSEEAEPEKKVKTKKTPPRIVIYQSGDTVTARDLETGEQASAVCSKDDTFDFHIGAFIAMSRLAGYADMLPVTMGNIELMEREIADFKNIVKAMMGCGDMRLSDDFFLRRMKSEQRA
jgi:hypothetical protein